MRLARSSAEAVDRECRGRGWRVVCHDCNERPILEGTHTRRTLVRQGPQITRSVGRIEFLRVTAVTREADRADVLTLFVMMDKITGAKDHEPSA
jgi:hypothetical protein